ncbi:hypothetical protein H1R20_g10099, partial [Candolleomyces eurysporus]
MATAATSDPETIDHLLATWAANGGPSDDEVIQYATEITSQLEDDEMVKKFQENVKEVGTWANEVDASFDRVSRKFDDMVAEYGKDFPGFSNYNSEWKGFNQRWVEHLMLSRDVASEHVAILRRFDQVFLDMVESIQSDQDRKDVIVELQSFIDEKHDRSDEMSRGFLDLKRDIEAFVPELDAWIKEQGAKLEKEAEDLKLEINTIQGQIDDLDKKIKDATTALTATSACLCIIGAIVAGSMLAKYKSQRNDKAKELQGKKDALEDVNRRQQVLANLQSDFDGVKPDISLICEKLVLFAEIWSSVRSQSVQFQEHLKGGYGAETNLRFKKEVRLARAMCGPLQAGLEKYASELENRANEKANAASA